MLGCGGRCVRVEESEGWKQMWGELQEKCGGSEKVCWGVGKGWKICREVGDDLGEVRKDVGAGEKCGKR